MKTILVYSGGLDSTVLLYYLLDKGHTLRVLSVNYGQRHVKEIDSAKAIARKLEIPFQIADLKSIQELLAGSSLTSPEVEVPHGHYEEEKMKTTVVANRNMIMLSLAAGWAISLNFDAVAYAAHGGDHAIYPDCRETFAEALDKAMRLADWHEVSLLRPFIELTKADIVKLGKRLGVPFRNTWTCYQGDLLHCGACASCMERREAFALAGVQDPTDYETSAPPLNELFQKNPR